MCAVVSGWRLEVLIPRSLSVLARDSARSRCGTWGMAHGPSRWLASSVVARWQRAVTPFESGVTAGPSVLRVPLDGAVPLLYGARSAGLGAGSPLAPRRQHAVHRARRVLLALSPLDQSLGTRLAAVLRIQLDHAPSLAAPVAARLGAGTPLGPRRQHAVDDRRRGLVARRRKHVDRRHTVQLADGR